MQQNMFQLTGVDQVIPVHGIEGAKSYPMGPNCRAPLFDDSEDVFYIKKTDQNGFPEIKRYRFEEEVIVDNSGVNGISLNDIRSIIREEMGSIKKEILDGQQFISTATVDSETANANANNITVNAAANDNGKHYATNKQYNGKGKPRQDSSVVANGEK